MKEKVITFKTAKLAKNWGFKNTNSNLWEYKSNGITYITNIKGGISGNEDTVQIVTQSLLQKWLRKLPDWPVEIYFKPELTKLPRKYRFFMWRRGVETDLGVFTTYEKGMEHALQQALQIENLVFKYNSPKP